MVEIILSFVSSVGTMASAIVAAIALVKTLNTQKQIKQAQIKQNTIEAFAVLQNEVLDKLVCVDKKNAEMIVDSLDNEGSKTAYDDYRTLIARLDRFAVGIEHEAYDFDVVYELAGEHLYCLYKKVEPIIVQANQAESYIKYYAHFVDLANKLNEGKRRK